MKETSGISLIVNNSELLRAPWAIMGRWFHDDSQHGGSHAKNSEYS